MTDHFGPSGPSSRSIDAEALDALARELLVASHALFESARSVQRHAPDAGDPPAGRRVSDVQGAALAALRSHAGALDALAAATGTSEEQYRSAGSDVMPTFGPPGGLDG